MSHKIAILGASGYTGAELVRLIATHPTFEIVALTGDRKAGQPMRAVYPHLRHMDLPDLCKIEDVDFSSVDMVFCALPHATSQAVISTLPETVKVVDLSADFRLEDEAAYEKWYGKPHTQPELLSDFVYGVPELHRDELKNATRIACAGCNATATILALKPLADAGLIDSAVVEVKAGSSEGGNSSSDASHHPERSGVVRSYRPTGHRHVAEMHQELGVDQIHFSATSIEMVRGILATCHVFLKQPMDEKSIWQLYRKAYGEERFIRIVKERSGIYRYPEPKLLSGSNYCDIGFEVDPHSNRVVVMSAIDNLMKGAAGQAVQAFNLMHGFEEDTGLGFTGLHPI